MMKKKLSAEEKRLAHIAAVRRWQERNKETVKKKSKEWIKSKAGKEYYSAYRKREDVRAKRREIDKREGRRIWRKEYRQRPDVKLKSRLYAREYYRQVLKVQ